MCDRVERHGRQVADLRVPVPLELRLDLAASGDRSQGDVVRDLPVDVELRAIGVLVVVRTELVRQGVVAFAVQGHADTHLLHVAPATVDDQGARESVVGRPHQSAAADELLREVFAVERDVLRVSVGRPVLQAEAAGQGLGDGTHQADKATVGAEAPTLEFNPALELLPRFARHDVDRAALRVAAEQRALRTTQYFDSFGVQEACVEADLRLVHAVEEHADCWLEATVEANAPDRQVLVIRCRARAARSGKVEVRYAAVRIRDVRDALLLQGRGVDRADGERHVYEGLCSLAGRDNHFVQSTGLCSRHWDCRYRSPSQQRKPDPGTARCASQ